MKTNKRHGLIRTTSNIGSRKLKSRLPNLKKQFYGNFDPNRFQESPLGSGFSPASAQSGQFDSPPLGNPVSSVPLVSPGPPQGGSPGPMVNTGGGSINRLVGQLNANRLFDPTALDRQLVNLGPNPYQPADTFTPLDNYANGQNGGMFIQNPNPLPNKPTYNGSVYGQFASGDVIENQQETVTKGLWSGNVASLLTFYTSSAQTATQKQYYYEVFNSASSGATAEPQFSVAYGNRNGSGSLIVGGGGNNDTVSRAIYSQYKLLLLEPGDTTFTINGVNTDQIYVINVNRARFRESLDPGNMQINLAELTGKNYANSVFTGSNVAVSSSGKYITLIDDSNINSAPTVGAAGRRYNLVSGSLDAGIYNSSNPVYYGLMYPQLGIMILNANMLNASASFNSATGSNVNGDNAFKLYTSISGAALITDAYGEKLGFEARSSELVKSAHYFVRVKNAEYNFSNNPSFVTGSDGDFSQPTFANDPQVYITTVGLYNPAGEMLAVAKLSKPLLKSFTREALVKVKLQF